MRRVGALVTLVVVAAALAACDGGDDVGVRRAGPAVGASFRFEIDDLGQTRPTYCPTFLVNFIDTSTGAPTEWHWTFGDPDGPVAPTTSTEQHPDFDPGRDLAGTTLRVELAVSNGADSDRHVEDVSFPVC